MDNPSYQELQEKYEPLIQRIPHNWKTIDIGHGWADLVLQLDKDLAAIDPNYSINQIKEKFGGLRYYTTHAHKEICGDVKFSECMFFNLVVTAQNQSYSICEKCGKPGELRDASWMFTACDEHSRGNKPLVDNLDEE